MSYIKTESFFIAHGSIGGLQMTMKTTDGTTVEFMCPFVPLGDDLAVAPVIRPDGGDKTLVVDFSEWFPVRITLGRVSRFPGSFGDQAVAVRVARAFDADPATSWTDPAPVILDWLRAWGPDHGLVF